MKEHWATLVWAVIISASAKMLAKFCTWAICAIANRNKISARKALHWLASWLERNLHTIDAGLELAQGLFLIGLGAFSGFKSPDPSGWDCFIIAVLVAGGFCYFMVGCVGLGLTRLGRRD